MNKIALFLVFLFSLCADTFGATPDRLMVAQLSWWNPEYLTVVYNGVYEIYSYGFKGRNGLSGADVPEHKRHDYFIKAIEQAKKYNSEEYKNICGIDLANCIGSFCIDSELNGNLCPDLYSIVLSIDGLEAKGLSPSDFYDKIYDGQTHNVKFINPQNKILNIKIEGNAPKLMNRTFGIKKEKDIEQQMGYANKDFSIMWDPNIDWSKIKTYSFILTDNKDVESKALLPIIEKNLAKWMKRCDTNPDILISISKDANRSVSYTYIPPSSIVYEKGSQIQYYYDWQGRTSYVDRNNQMAIHTDGGFERQTVRSQLFFEICFLDIKRIKDTDAPVIYKLIAQYDDNVRRNAQTEYETLSQNCLLPMELNLQRGRCEGTLSNKSLGDLYLHTGTQGELITYVSPNSEAYKSGMRIGDEIDKVKWKKGILYVSVIREGKKIKLEPFSDESCRLLLESPAISWVEFGGILQKVSEY